MPRRDPLAIQLITLPRVLMLVATIAFVVGLQWQRRNLMVLGAGATAWLFYAWLFAPRLESVRVRRDHPERVFEGDHVRISLRLEPPAGRRRPAAIRYVELSDDFPASGTFYVRGVMDGLFVGGRGGELVYRPRASRRRGLYVLGPVELAASDPTGLRYSVASLEVFSGLIVYPSVVPIEAFRPYDTWTVRHLGERTLLHRGISQEFLDVREYRRGDSPRAIHWPVSARHGTLYVKTYEDAVMTTITIFLDLFWISHSGLGEVTSEEAMVSAAATLATLGIEQSHRVGLVGLAGEPVVIPPAAGQAQLAAILHALALARPGGGGDFAAGVRRHLPLVDRGGTVVFTVAATTATTELESIAAELVLRGDRVVAVVVDDRSYHAISLEQQMRRVAERSFGEVVAGLARAGAAVYTLDKGCDPRARLETAGGGGAGERAAGAVMERAAAAAGGVSA